jgi:hypothetical protein
VECKLARSIGFDVATSQMKKNPKEGNKLPFKKMTEGADRMFVKVRGKKHTMSKDNHLIAI